MGRATILLLLVALSTAALLGSARAECVVRLDINTAASQLIFSGTSQASIIPTAFPVTLVEPPAGAAAPAIGLAGSMYLRTAAPGPCPATAQDWLAAAGSMQLTTAPSGYLYKPLALFPPVLATEVMGLPLNLSAVQLNITLSAKGRPPAAEGTPFRIGVNGTVTNGYVFSNSPLTGGAQLQALRADSSVSTSKALLNLTEPGGLPLNPSAAEGPAQLNLALPEFKLTFASKSEGVGPGGRPWSGTFTFSLTGALYLSGLVDCPTDCGDYGRCIALNSSSSSSSKKKDSPAAQFACECECGYSPHPTSGRCEIANGTCPVFGSDAAGSNPVVLLSSPSGNHSSSGGSNDSASSCSGGTDAVAATAGTCPVKYGFDVDSRTCRRCEDGWGGPGCKLCATDDACKTKLSKSQAICNTGLLFNERSQDKYYSCQLTNPSVAKIVGPVLPIHCTTGGNGGKSSGSTGSAMAVSDSSLLSSTAQCSIAMRLAGMPLGTTAQCTATGCRFAEGEPSFECDGVACDCPSGCPPMYLKTFKDVSGVVTVDCDATGSACNIVIGSLNMKLQATCEASECLDPAGPKLVGSKVQRNTGPPLGPPLLAALPLLALVLGGLVCAAALVRYMPYLRSKQHGGPAAAAAAAAAAAVSSKRGSNKASNNNSHHSPLAVKGGPGPLGEGTESNNRRRSATASGAAGGGSAATTPATGGYASRAAAAAAARANSSSSTSRIPSSPSPTAGSRRASRTASPLPPAPAAAAAAPSGAGASSAAAAAASAAAAPASSALPAAAAAVPSAAAAAADGGSISDDGSSGSLHAIGTAVPAAVPAADEADADAKAAAAAAAGAGAGLSPREYASAVSSPVSGFNSEAAALNPLGEPAASQGGLVSDGSTPRSSPTATTAGAGAGAAGAAAAAVPFVPLLRVNVPPRPSAAGSSCYGSGQIQELSFYDVTADVRIHRGFKERLRTALHRGGSSSSGGSGAAAAGTGGAAAAAAGGKGAGGDLEQGGIPGSKSSGSLADGVKSKLASKNNVTNGNRSPLSRVAAAAGGGGGSGGNNSRAPRATDDDTLPLTEQLQQLSVSLPGSSGGSSGSDGCYLPASGSSGGVSSSSSSARWRRVLQGVSGCVGSGEVLGIMGPSGGGKSTLLMKLCGGLGGHSRGGEWRSGGVVCLDGVVVTPSLLTAVTALVPQDDSLMRSLTVEECIRYSAALRLDPSLPPAAVNARVESVMDSLGLAKIRRSTVLSGTGVSGVSGGERRRVAIAMELVIDPQVLVLDEPLSGLDSFTALQLMRSLQAVAASGRVVALSLHQPSPALFGALDTAMLLAGGLVVYSGPPSSAAAALAGLGCPVPPGITVAEHLLHVVSDPASLRHVVAAAAQQQQQQQQVAALPAPLDAQQQQQLDLHRELSQHAAAQQVPPHLQSAAAATAASLAGSGSAAAAAGFSKEQQQQGNNNPLSPKPSWMQRLTGGGAAASQQQQQQHYGSSMGGGVGMMNPQMSQQMTNQQPLSPKPSWYHRISAIKPLKAGRPTAASRMGLAAGPNGQNPNTLTHITNPYYGGAGGGGVYGGGIGSSTGGGAGGMMSGVGPAAGAAAGGSKAARLALGLPKQQRPFSRQIGVLFWRGLLDMLRNPLLTAFHALGGMMLGLLVGVIFFGVKSDTSGAQNRVGAIFFALCLLAFTSVTSVDLIQAESSAAGREMQRRYYSPLAYAVTKLVLDGLLLRALPALLFALPFYFLMGLNAAALQVVVFMLVLVGFSSTVGALALGFASSLDSPGKTILVMNLVLLLGVLFGGFLANKDSIPVWLRWVSWLSVFRYAWEALVINELSGLDLFLSAPGVSLSLPVKGQVFLQIIGVDSSLFLVDIAVLVAMYFAACTFVVCVLAWRHRVRG